MARKRKRRDTESPASGSSANDSGRALTGSWPGKFLTMQYRDSEISAAPRYTAALGEPDLISMLATSRPNMYALPLNGPYFDSALDINATNTGAQGTNALIVSEDIDNLVMASVYNRVRAANRFRFMWTSNNLKNYVAAITWCIMAYNSINNAMDLIDQRIPRLRDLDTAFLDQDFLNVNAGNGNGPTQATRSYTAAALREIRVLLSSMAFPLDIQAELSWLLQWRRLGERDDAPVGGYYLGDIDATSTSWKPTNGYDRSSQKMVFIRDLQNVAYQLATNTGYNRLSADLAVYLGDGQRVNLPESPMPVGGHDAEWMQHWQNSGWASEISTETSEETEAIKQDVRVSQNTLSFDVDSKIVVFGDCSPRTLSSLFVGRGGSPINCLNYYLGNDYQVDGSSRLTDFGTPRVGQYYSIQASSTEANPPIDWRDIDHRPGLTGDAHDVMRMAHYAAHAKLGYKCIAQYVGDSSGQSWREGIQPLSTPEGEITYTDTHLLSGGVLAKYRSLWGLAA